MNTHTYLGLTFAYNLKWSHHIDDLSIKARQKFNMMIPLKFKLDRKSIETMYNSFIRSAMEYGNVVWGNV